MYFQFKNQDTKNYIEIENIFTSFYFSKHLWLGSFLYLDYWTSPVVAKKKE